MSAPSDLLRLEGILSQYPSAVIALSGGIDSTVVAAAAQRALGSKALAVTLLGPSLPSRDRRAAVGAATRIGIRHVEAEVNQLSSPDYVRNPSDRCYYCRNLEGGELQRLARSWGMAVVLDGVHQDDLKEDRPGLRAMDEWGFKHPLIEAELGKEQVRAIARNLGLPNSETPSNSCLASRVQSGQPITHEILERVDRAEDYLGSLGFARVRVRVRGTTAEVQVGAGELPRLREAPTWSSVQERLTALGFTSVTMDPVGYRAVQLLHP